MIHARRLSLLLLIALLCASCSSFTAFVYQGRLEYGPRESNGRQKGLWKYWYDADHATLRAQGNFESDKPVGRWEFFHPNGTKRFEVSFRNESYDGPSRAWWPNGALRSQGTFDAGLETGAWTFWDESGAKSAEGSFARGARDGTWRYYAPGGEVRSELVFERGAVRSSTPAARVLEPGALASAPEAPAGREAVIAAEAVPPTPSIGVVSAPLTIVQDGRAARDASVGNLSAFTTPQLAEIYDTGKVLPIPGTGIYQGEGAARPPWNPARDDGRSDPFLGKPLPWTRLVQGDGTPLDLADFRGRSKVLVIVLRGLQGRICEYCAAQTEALQRRAKDFRDLNCEIVIVYPGASERLDQFVTAAREYYQVHYGEAQPASTCRLTCDDGFQLVEALKLRKDLARPAAFLLDQESIVRFAWVSENKQDRPSCEKLLTELRKL